MNRDEVWSAISEHRLRLCDLLSELSEEELRRPSLCDGWTVRDVIAHLTLQQLTLGTLLGELVRHPAMSINKATHDLACRRAERPAPDLIADIRSTAGSQRHNFGVTPLETLIDCLVHSQDIVMPLGRRLDLPPGAAAVAASRVWSIGWPFHAAKRLNGFRLTATDADWSAGEGLPVQAPIAAILLVGSGRLVALPQFTGDGAAALTAKLAPVTASTGGRQLM